MIRAICIWAVVYFPSAHAGCSFLNRSIKGYETKNWATPTLPSGSTRKEIATVTITLNMENCPATGGDIQFGPVMRQFSNAGMVAFNSVSSKFENGVLTGRYINTNRPTFVIEATASLSNFQPSNCIRTITGTTITDPDPNTPIIRLTYQSALPCKSFRYTSKIVVVQTANLIWEDGWNKVCKNPEECLLTWWINTQLWNGLITGGSTSVLPYIPPGQLRLEAWAKFPPSPPPPPPSQKCVVQLQSAPTRSRL